MTAPPLRCVDLAVIGAGPAGLSAAWRAAENGHNVILIERASHVGGMAASFEVGGIRVDHGSHRLHPATPPHILSAVQRLLGEELQCRPRNGRLRVRDQWVKFPLHASELARALPLSFALRSAAAGLGRSRRRARLTFEDEVRARVGGPVAEEIYVPFARKLWDTEPDQLDGELARRRVAVSSPLALARRTLQPRSASRRVFFYPTRGFGQLSEALADAATSAGAGIELSTAVERLSVDGDAVNLQLSGGQAVQAAHVFSTMPLATLAARVEPAPPRNLVADLPARAMLLVYLVVEIPRWTAFDAHYFPAGGHRVSRLSEPKNYRDGRDPAGVTVLCAEIPCWEEESLWGAGPEELASIVKDALAREDLPVPTVARVEVRRLRGVYPVYRVGFRAALDGLLEWADGLGRVVTLGRGGLFVPDNTHHALAMGWDAAEALRRDGSFDVHSWSQARQRYNDHVVED